MKKQQSRAKTLWMLFYNMLYISAFTFGGGFVIVTLMKHKFVDELGWLDEQEMLDMTVLSQSSPGPIAVNAAILVGWRTAGFWGMAVAVLGTIIPPMIILSVISFFYAAFAANRYVALVLRGMQAGVAAVIMDVVCSLGLKVFRGRSVPRIILMFLAFAAAFFLHLNVMLILLAAAVLGVVLAYFEKRKEGRA